MKRFTPFAFLCAGLAIVSMPAIAADESDSAVKAEQPVLGYVRDAKAGGLRAILGVAESPRFSDPVELPEGLSILAIAPGQDWALATRASEAGGEEAGAFEISTGHFVRLSEDVPGKFAFSPSGRDVALYSRANGAVRSFRGLPGTPRAALRFETEAVDAIAVSDGGSYAAIRSGSRLEAVSASGRAFLGESESVTAFAFVPGGDALLTYDKRSGVLSRFDDPMAAGSVYAMPEAIEGMDLMAAGRDEITLAKSSGGVVVLNHEGKVLRNVETPPVKSLELMRIRSLRLLSYEEGEPAWLFGLGGVSAVPAVREVVE